MIKIKEIKYFFNFKKLYMSSYLNYNKYTIKRKTYIAAVENKYTYIILLNNITHIGDKGEIIKIKRGCARNLIKERKAVYATYENVDNYADKEKYQRNQRVDIKKSVLIEEDFEKYFAQLKNIDITIYLDTYKYTNNVSYNLYDFFNYISNNYELDLTHKNLHKINYYKNKEDYSNDKKQQIYSDINNLNDLIIQNNSFFKYTGIYVIYYYLFLPNTNFLNEIIFRISSLQEYELMKDEKNKKTDIIYSID
ncbi:50S ribosomal protein L9, mitochondrial, putative [Plasmodium relictum]|uniref:50S ribosomal protein L9, mitochondrial, putative n=1 Tax=Plasmodium relictum TaxID=85471 RepID=A0A1J1H6Z8_PLARL|nr:50S ribosomal protein L9, mitochondrial, putative [Plasmodium relictum]CRH00726.1 50S ribosomal protein L9, mitochondrial, putative [Plasmodium relictum]